MKLGQLSDLITLVSIGHKDLLNQLDAFSNYSIVLSIPNNVKPRSHVY